MNAQQTHNENVDRFVLDMDAIRKQAESRMEDGAVIGDALPRSAVVELLQQVLATEIVCWMRYMAHYHLADGLKATIAADEFLEHANEERGHLEIIAERIAQLGGKPDFSPDSLSGRSHADYGAPDELRAMLEQDLVAERMAILTYRKIVDFLGDRDPTTRRMMEEILEQEEEHADDLAGLLEDLN